LIEGQNINIISPCVSAGEERDRPDHPCFRPRRIFSRDDRVMFGYLDYTKLYVIFGVDVNILN